MTLSRRSCCPPQGRELLLLAKAGMFESLELLSPAGARVVTGIRNQQLHRTPGCCPPQGRKLLLAKGASYEYARVVAVPRRGASCYKDDYYGEYYCVRLLSPAGARVVTSAIRPSRRLIGSCCPPQGRELLHHHQSSVLHIKSVAVPRRGASCYLQEVY